MERSSLFFANEKIFEEKEHEMQRVIVYKHDMLSEIKYVIRDKIRHNFLLSLLQSKRRGNEGVSHL